MSLYATAKAALSLSSIVFFSFASLPASVASKMPWRFTTSPSGVFGVGLMRSSHRIGRVFR
jgi:hypothetical protein